MTLPATSSRPLRPLAAGLALLGGTLLGGGLLSPAARGQITATGGSRSLGTLVNGGSSCSSGPCTISGGRSRGENLFHRLDRFDTRGGISGVDVRNGSHRTVVMGVIGKDRTHITVPVGLENRGGLILMSPAGISVSGGGSFQNVNRLALTNQTDLNVGGRWFNAFSTTAGDLNNAAFASPINFERSSLRTDQATLNAIGVASPGSIEIKGVQLVVARNLLSDIAEPTPADPAPEAPPPPTVLIDAGPADLSLSNAVLHANDLRNSTTPNPLAGEASLAVYGRAITLTDSRLEATGSSQLANELVATADGLLNLQADGDLTLTNSTLKGLKIGLRGTNVDLSGSTAAAARGVIQVEAANRITLEGSTLDVAPKTAADVLGQGLGFVFRDPQLGIALSSVPALISLSSSGSAAEGIRINNSQLDASSLVAELELGIPENERNPQNLIGGNVLVSSNGNLTVNESALTTSADQDFAGQITLVGLAPEAVLSLSDSTFTANAVNGSGDISAFSQGPVRVLNSTLEANTTGADFGIDLAIYGALFNPSGEIKIASQASDGIAITNSILRSRYSFENDPASPFSKFQDILDELDNPDFTMPLGGLIRLSSAGSIAITGESLLDAGSSTGIGGSIELFSAGGRGVSVDNSELFAKTDGPLPDEIISLFYGVPPEPYEGLRAGQIDILSANGISINSSILDTSLATVTQVFDLNSFAFTPLTSRINLLSGSGSGASLSLTASQLLASAPTNVSGDYRSQGGTITLASDSGVLSTSDDVSFNVDGDDPGSIQEITDAPDALSNYLNVRHPYEFSNQTFAAILNRETGLDGGTPFSLQQRGLIGEQLTGSSTTLIIINSNPADVRVVAINQALQSTLPSLQQTVQTFDTTTQAGLLALGTFLRAAGVDEADVTNVVNTLSQQSGVALTTPTGEGGADGTSPQDGEAALASSLANLTTLSVVQTTASLLAGEAASSQRLTEYLGESASAPPVPTLASLQQLLRLAGAASSDSTAEPAAILRLSYSEEPQVLGRMPHPGGWQDGDLLAQASSTGTGAGSLDLVLVTSEGQPLGWRTSIQLAELRNLLRAYYSNLAEQNLAMEATAPPADAVERRLFELLFRAPLQQLEQQRIGTLIISADPSLIDIPWNALHDGDRYLSQRFALAVTPSLAFTNLAAAAGGRSTSAGQRMNAGASLFNNGLTPLPMVEKELAELSEQPGQQGQVTTLLNRDFNPGSFSSGFAAAGTRQVHIASHAEIAAGPQRIPTIYTGDTALSLRELGQLRQRSGSGNLDLVTLSACRSALNGADLELGFAGLAVQLGAKTAIGTKWYVDDLATSSFFVLFYRQLQQGLAKADALRATQRAFAGGQVRVEGTQVIGPGGAVLLAQLPESYQHRYTRGFSHPYYWAGVQLVGSPW